LLHPTITLPCLRSAARKMLELWILCWGCGERRSSRRKGSRRGRQQRILCA
jgi:hypothetical protein